MLYRRVNRAFTAFKKVAWVAVPAIAVGGLFYTWLGFAVIGIMLALMGLSLCRGALPDARSATRPGAAQTECCRGPVAVGRRLASI